MIQPIGAADILRHWQMFHHLMWEIQRRAWPYAEEGQAYRHDRHGFKGVLEFAKRDPRFIEEGLVWEQPPCRWLYQDLKGIAALGQFFGEYVGTGRNDHQALCKWEMIEVKCGYLRTWSEKQVQLAMKAVDRSLGKEVPKEFDFMNPELYAQKSAPTEYYTSKTED